MKFDCLQLQKNGQISSIWLNRPDVHNAFNDKLIAELHTCLDALTDDENTRVVVLAGRGASFSAGADLHWMKKAGTASTEENIADAKRLADMLYALAHLKKPTIARVHGAAFGGGMGLAAACDICIASSQARFATSEVRLGLAPSTISPYVVRAIGRRQAHRYFLTAERIDAERALMLGLVHELCSPDEIDEKVNEIAQAILQGAPIAQTEAKTLIAQVANQHIDKALLEHTAWHIARLRQSDEAKEGLQAFLEKRKATWIK